VQPFPEQTYQTRNERAQSLLAEWDVSGLLIGSSANRRWLTGFTGSAGWVLVTPDRTLLATDFRYWEQAAVEAPVCELLRVSGSDGMTDLVREVSGARLAVEADHLTVTEFQRLDALEGVTFDARKETLEPLRAQKDEDETIRIRAAAVIADKVMSQVPMLARRGMSEVELAWELEKRLREYGADAVAFPVIVAGGPNAALPHHHPGSRRLEPGDALVVDLGATVAGYHSDLTRTFYLGAQPDQRFLEIYGLVRAAQEAAIGALQAGQSGRDVDAAARDLIVEAGYGDMARHGFGHGVGLEIHERPGLSPRADDDILTEGMVTTIEPGVYLPGWGGVRLEDLLLVNARGHESLSSCARIPAIPPGKFEDLRGSRLASDA
jgi:Xaa-Pro aminopeptidase